MEDDVRTKEYAMFAAIKTSDLAIGPVATCWQAQEVRKRLCNMLGSEWKELMRRGWRVRKVRVVVPL
jgi:hypothetical protein